MLEIMQVAKLDKVQTRIRGIAIDMNTIYPHSWEAQHSWEVQQEALH